MGRAGSGVGNGDLCPLWPEHGNMLVIPNSDPPKQFCPHVQHDGPVGSHGAIAPSRSVWPLYGFADSVTTYLARLDRAVRQASADALPDVSLPYIAWEEAHAG
jgi:hypothetical protein